MQNYFLKLSLIFILIFLIIGFYAVNRAMNDFMNPKITKTMPTKTKRVLFLDVPFFEVHQIDDAMALQSISGLGLPGALHHHQTIGPKYFEFLNCSVTNCIMTTNRNSSISKDQFDGIIVEQSGGPILSTAVRNRSQVYMFYNYESPAYTYETRLLSEGFYNWTLTYRLDSDIFSPYGIIQNKKTKEFVAPSLNPQWLTPDEEFELSAELEEMINGKNRTILWFVSNCFDRSGRLYLAKNLQKYIQVDIYGSCSLLKCPRFSVECDEILLLDRQYKFYLSFENSLCTDYVTEKLFKALNRSIIPIVFGGADYNRFAPPHSYINVESFDTIEHLAKYLRFLDANPKEYRKYFWWKNYYHVQEDKKFCKICSALNDPLRLNAKKYYKDINDWWKRDKCRDSTLKELRASRD